MHDDPARILIVEDEIIVAMDLESDLARIGYAIAGVASDARQAFHLAIETNPQLVLMDIALPGPYDGIQAARDIQAHLRVPIVFLTANANRTTFAQACEIQPSAYLTKPYRVGDLEAAIAIALRQHTVVRALFAEKTWYDTILSSLSEGILATDENGIVRYISPLAAAITGWAAAEALGQPLEQVFRLTTLNGQTVEELPLRQAIRLNAAVPRSEFSLLTKAGKRTFIEEAASPIAGADGSLVGGVSVILDISERRRAELEREALRRELERSNDELQRFGFALAHDLVSPARSIHGLSESLIRGEGGAPTEPQARTLQLILTSASDIQRLVDSMLRFARVGHGQLSRDRFRADDVCAAVEVRLAVAIRESHASIQCSNLPVIEADRLQIEQVFQNLISNAIQYRRPDVAPVIRIEGEEIEGGWRFAVEDNGQGVPSEYLDRIFLPLKRLHGREIPGTGLGLVLCRRIVERHRGRIWAESLGPGRGTTVRFTIHHPDSHLSPGTD